MGWGSAFKKNPPSKPSAIALAANDGSWRPAFEAARVDWDHLVVLDFETYWDEEYTLSKMTTSEYIRDPRFEAQMCGIKIGKKPTVVVRGDKLAAFLKKIDWTKHDLLCHHTHFDGFILSHHYGVIPRKYYCTLSMARGWLANDIGASLDEVAKYYGYDGKLDGGMALVNMKGIRLKNMHPEVYAEGAKYCGKDIDLCLDIFANDLLVQFSQPELDLIDVTVQMFTCPVIRLDEARARKAMVQEIKDKEALLESVAPPIPFDEWPSAWRSEFKKLHGEAREEHKLKMFCGKKAIGSNKFFPDMLRAEGVEPPIKISPAWMKLDAAERELMIEKKYAYAFASTDPEFVALGDDINPRLRALVEARISVKSTITVSRAARLLASGKGGRPVPVYYKFAGAHTWRFSGGDKQNFQNFTRGGELRLSLLAPKGYVLVVQDSGQIEARVNAWLWGQHDLLNSFREGRDVYSEFATVIYGRTITRADSLERHVGKTAILGLGYQMGHVKFRATLARGVGGPAVHISEPLAQSIVNTYRKVNSAIRSGWGICEEIIEQMFIGRQGEYKCIRWEKETIWLPNGMRLKYPDLHKDEDDNWVYRRKGAWIKLYGGILCENIVQALARIIVAADQLLAISRRYPVVMTTHDEVVACVSKKEAKACEAFMNKVMRTPPGWCSDIPLAAEGGYAENYSK